MGHQEDEDRKAARSIQLGRIKERRQAKRQQARGLVAYYWDGNVPVPHEIRGISLSGMYLMTAQRWYPGTLIRMTLQSARGSATGPENAITIQAKAVRSGEDGVGVAFVLPELHDAKTMQTLGYLANRNELEAFLRKFLKDHRRDKVDDEENRRLSQT